MIERNHQSRFELLQDEITKSQQDTGRELRADFCRAFAEVIAQMGGDKTDEFMTRLQHDAEHDVGVSPDLLRDMQANSPGAAQAVFDRWEEICDERNQQAMAELEARSRQFIQRKQDIESYRAPSLGQRALELVKETWRGFGTIHF